MKQTKRRWTGIIGGLCLWFVFTGCLGPDDQTKTAEEAPAASPNTAPAPTAPFITTALNTASTSQVTANDPNAGQSHTFRLTTPPARGTATVSATGLVTYTPMSGFTGSDSFVVTVTDNGTTPLAATVTLSVQVLSWDQVAREVAAGALQFLRAILTPDTTGGLPRNEATQRQLTTNTFPAHDFFVPAQLGQWLSAAVLSHALRTRDATFTAGFATDELRAHVQAAVTALEHILATQAFTDPVTGGKALYQVHRTPTGEAPRGTDFERTVSLLDNTFLTTGLQVTRVYLAGLDPALAVRIDALLAQFHLGMWVENDTLHLGGPDNPRGGGVLDRIVSESRLAAVAARARDELPLTTFQTIIHAMLATSRPGTTQSGVVIAHLPFGGTALEIWAATPYVAPELTTRLGTSTLVPLVTAWEETRRQRGLPAASATGIANGFGQFTLFAFSPAEDTTNRFLDRLVLIPPAAALEAGAMGTPTALENLGRTFQALHAAGKFDPRFGVPNAFDVGGTGLVNEADPVRGTLEIAQMAVALLNYLLPPTQRLEALLRQDAGWDAALAAYGTLLNGGLVAPVALVREAEDGPLGRGGRSIPRAHARESQVWHLDRGDEARYVFPVVVTGSYTLVVRYSNDDSGVGDVLQVLVDGAVVGTLHTQDTRGANVLGSGWDVFVDTPALPLGMLPAGQRTITLRLETSDGSGVDLDRLTLLPVP